MKHVISVFNLGQLLWCNRGVPVLDDIDKMFQLYPPPPIMYRSVCVFMARNRRCSIVAVVVVTVHVSEGAVNKAVEDVLVVVVCREEVERSASPYPQDCRY